ncbi:MAG TPA: UvrD-helicase domain-containing protein [Thermoanaerobaculia bacterium]|nr:UvrD-helicase domain-containing protein [Thermoanaerobaculia bacterium]
MKQQAFDFAPRARPSRRNLVIEAGAGTGKTTAIVAEVLKLMMERDDLAPERIVLMTFTEKAAGEIADRIRLALEELSASEATAWPIGSPNPLVTSIDRERARRHLENIDHLRSQTIHSFCQSLLRAFPIEAGLDPQFKIIEGFERSLLYGQLYDAWVDDETRVHPTPEIEREWELLFTHAGYLFQIRDLILGMIERRDLLNETGYDFGTFAEVEEPLIDALSAIRRTSDIAGDEQAQALFAYIRETTPPESDDIDEWLAYLHPIAAPIREANLPRHGVLKEALKILRAGNKGRSMYDRLVSHRAAMALLAMTRRFLVFLDHEKRQLGVVDFDDLLLRTLALLDDETVLARARAQFDFIFVDEFQDTDRTQARIVDKLARDASGQYVDGKTIVVGDPKQSIYGFRRADPETYYRITEELVRGGAERRLLVDQYRSDAPLLDAINTMFARLFPDAQHDPNVFRPAYTPLRARRVARASGAPPPEARFTLLHAMHEDSADRFFAEGAAIAEWIRKNSDGDLRRFAILFRRLTKLDDYLDTLDRYGIAYVLPPTRMFLDRRAPVDLLAVLRAIAHPFDKGAQISAARTPYFALTDEEVVAGVLGDGVGWQEFQKAIEQYREASRHLTVSQLIDLIVRTSNIEGVYDAAADGVRHLRHLEHLRAIAFEYDQRAGGSAGQFVEEIARRRGEPDEVEPSLIDESQNAVRILSVHAAKGLEFDTVILPDLAVQPPTNDLQLFTVEEPRSIVLTGRADSISANFRVGEDGEKLKKLAGRREEAENRRLFYVAVTRAKTDVVFVCNFGEDTKNVGFLKCLCETTGIDRATTWPDEGREVRGSLAFEKLAISGAGARVRRRLNDVSLEHTLATSEIVPFEIATPPAAATLTSGEIAARRAGSRNRAAGILLHRVLERWDGRADIEPLLQQLASEAAANAEAVLRVRRRLATIAKSDMLQRIARAETLGREVPVRFVEDGTLVERRIDRLIRENGAEVVIDYKSGLAEEARVAKDREQVARYCRAISGITGRACAGVLWYVDAECDQIVEV